MRISRVGDTRPDPIVHKGSYVVWPISEASRRIWERREHAVFGISPGNSYFKVARMTELFGWLCTEFDRVDVVIPDSSLVHTYLALGYEPQRAERKARAETNVLHNRVVRAWDHNGGPRAADGLHRLSELTADSVYQDKLAECERALRQDDVLKRTSAEMSREVLALKGHEGPLTAHQIGEAVRYLVAELPFFVASSDIFGAPTSLNFYHRELPLAEAIFSGETMLQPSPRQAYATIRPAR